MAEEFDVSCPKCSMVFTVPRELCGEMAECSECTTVFEIPFPEEVPVLESTDTGAIRGIAPQPEEVVDTTNTVKLSRTGIGMIPNLKDSFEFGTKAPPPPPGATQHQKPGIQFSIPSQKPAPPSMPQAPVQRPPVQQQVQSPQQQRPPQQQQVQPPQQQQAPVQQQVPQQQQQVQQSPQQAQAKKPTFKKPPTAGATSQTPATQAQAQPSQQTQITQAPAAGGSVKIPDWAKVSINKDEEVYACSESKDNAFLFAGLVSLPSLLCIAMPFLGNWGAAGAAVIAIATFATVLFIVLGNGKKLVILTSQRAVSVFGKKKIEAKK